MSVRSSYALVALVGLQQVALGYCPFAYSS